MFKIAIEFMTFLIVALLLITQVLWSLTDPNRQLFWLFRKKIQVSDTPKKDVDESIEQMAHDLEVHADQLKKSVDKVDNTIETLTEIKKKSTNNLNN